MKLKPWTGGDGWMTARQKKRHQKETEASAKFVRESPLHSALVRRYLELKQSQSKPQ